MKRYVIGCLSGVALWLVLVAIDRAFLAGVTNVVSFALWPLAAGLWWFSGDNHLTLMRNMPLNVAAGLLLWGGLGVLAARLWGRRRAPDATILK